MRFVTIIKVNGMKAVLAALTFIIAAQQLAAEEVPATAAPYILPAAELSPAFEPVDAFIIYQYDGSAGVFRMPAFFEGGKAKVVGAPLTAAELGQSISYTAILIGRSGEMLAAPFVEKKIESLMLDSVAIDEEREALLGKKQALQSVEVQIKAQEESLRRLRADAEVVANLGQIVQIKEDTDRLKREQSSLARDIKNLEGLIHRAKSLPQPQNFSKREIQLTQDVSELATLASGAESGELERRALSEGQLQDRMLLLEQARFENIDQLQGEYEALEREARARGITVLDSASPATTGK